jgi:membrane associated rhomboid family serine protease
MFRTIPPVTRAILIANVIVYLLELVTSGTLIDLFALWPLGPMFHPWQVVTYAFLHDPRTFLHIFFNMFALYMFGGALENFWGSRRFGVFYFASVLAAAATELLVLTGSGVVEPVLGASGGVFGLLLGFAWFFPRQRLVVLPIPIPLPAWLFVTIYGALELVLGVTGTQDSVAHFAHLGGMLGGAITILLWRTRDSDRSAFR